MSLALQHYADVKWRVLVADDQPSVIDALMLLFKSQGINADHANTPDEVEKLVAAETYDLLLMDMNYARDTTSGAEGLELLARIRSADPALAVVVMTAWSTVEIAVAALQRGANDFIQKPWENIAALRIIEKQMAVTRERRRADAIRAEELDDASLVQRTLMGASLKLFGRFTAAGITRSHREVGGDYYDLIQTAENSAALCIADVMGKGIGAALLMANMQAHYRNLIERGLGPAALMQSLNRTVSDSAANGKLVSMIAARLDINSGKLIYSNAGHPPGIIVRSNGHAELLSTEDAILGALSSWNYKERECILESGDRLVLATDGFFEAASADGQEVGAEKLIEWCIDAKTLPAPELLTHLNRKLDDFCEAQLCDDATLLVVSAE